MKIKSIKTKFAVALGAVCCTALIAAACVCVKDSVVYADESGAAYSQSYRNRLAYSAKSGWNNDPNGLLYVPAADGNGGTYHMYYQYNWDKNANGGAGGTENVWGHMSWGHATSSDLVHWSEQPVALSENSQDKDGNNYSMMFSGSAVYDVDNTSGLFDTDEVTGKVVKGQGIVAILTQPDDSAGGQRQILAYSKDDGQTFEVDGEILGARDDGGVGDGEFRDPKVFWSDRHSKWLMAVGGGSVRMYSSVNLTDWEYLGQTGYWGECPDISRYEVNGAEKYVLIISPEDKAKSHEYNKTTRAETYYPAEYYVVGELDENGLFVSKERVKRLSEGIDSYAFQSFNNAPDGKVYGVSWSASWKTVSGYEPFREDYNGGMTVVCGLDLVETDGGYSLLRYPVGGYESLRSAQPLGAFGGTLKGGERAFTEVKASEADIVAEIDFSVGNATYAQFDLRVSAQEKIAVRYDRLTQTLTLDRSRSSLLAKDTPLYKTPYSKKVELVGGKLSLRIILDRAFISVFANGGRASWFSAVFPAAVSDKMALYSDGDLAIDAQVYAVESIFGDIQTVDKLVLSTEKIDTVVGAREAVAASSFADGFDFNEVKFTVAEGGAKVALERADGFVYIKALNKGSAKIAAEYKGSIRLIEVYIYNDGFISDLTYGERLGGFSFVSDEGLRFATGASDAFLFSKTQGEEFVYSAYFTPRGNAQAGGLIFGISDNLTDYLVATADLHQNKVKLWKSGVGDLKVADFAFNGNSPFKLTVAVSGGEAKVSVDDRVALIHNLSDYGGGRLGLNVYNAEMDINRVKFNRSEENRLYIGAAKLLKVINVTDNSYRLSPQDYSVEGGYLTIGADYLKTLEAGAEYAFRAVTETTDYDFTVTADFASASLVSMKDGYLKGDALAFKVTDGVAVERLEINGRQVAFTLDGGIITVSAADITHLTGGEHTVKAYTAKGRPSLTISIAGKEDYREDYIEAISHTFFYIDIAIFAAAIIGYAVFAIVKRCRKKKQ